MIFDCCHSASGTRTGDIDPTWRIRGIDVEDMEEKHCSLYESDQNIWKDIPIVPTPRAVRPPPPHFTYSGLSSHVFLAACGALEKAQEDKGRGRFTHALLQELAVEGAETLSYCDLVNRLPAIPGLVAVFHSIWPALKSSL